MPRQIPNNQQNPSRMRPGPAANAMGALGQPGDEGLVELTQSNPNLQNSQVNMGSVQFGQGANQIGGNNIGYQLAEMIGTGIKAAETTVGVVNQVATMRDQSLKDDMDSEMTELEGQRKDKGELWYTQQKDQLLRKYQGQFSTRRFKSPTKRLITENEFAREDAPLTDHITEYEREKNRIMRSPEYNQMPDGDIRRAEDLKHLNETFFYKMEAHFGKDERSMARVYGALGQYRDPEDVKTAAATKELTKYKQKIDDAIQFAVEDMAQNNVFYESPGAMAEDILARTGISDDFRESMGGALESTMLDMFHERIEQEFNKNVKKANNLIGAQQKQELSRNKILLSTAVANGDVQQAVVISEAVADGIVQNYRSTLASSTDDVAQTVLSQNLEAHAQALLPTLSGSPEQRQEKLIDSLEKIAMEAGGIDLETLSVYGKYGGPANLKEYEWLNDEGPVTLTEGITFFTSHDPSNPDDVHQGEEMREDVNASAAQNASTRALHSVGLRHAVAGNENQATILGGGMFSAFLRYGRGEATLDQIRVGFSENPLYAPFADEMTLAFTEILSQQENGSPGGIITDLHNQVDSLTIFKKIATDEKLGLSLTDEKGALNPSVFKPASESPFLGTDAGKTAANFVKFDGATTEQLVDAGAAAMIDPESAIFKSLHVEGARNETDQKRFIQQYFNGLGMTVTEAQGGAMAQALNKMLEEDTYALGVAEFNQVLEEAKNKRQMNITLATRQNDYDQIRMSIPEDADTLEEGLKPKDIPNSAIYDLEDLSGTTVNNWEQMNQIMRDRGLKLTEKGLQVDDDQLKKRLREPMIGAIAESSNKHQGDPSRYEASRLRVIRDLANQNPLTASVVERDSGVSLVLAHMDSSGFADGTGNGVAYRQNLASLANDFETLNAEQKAILYQGGNVTVENIVRTIAFIDGGHEDSEAFSRVPVSYSDDLGGFVIDLRETKLGNETIEVIAPGLDALLMEKSVGSLPRRSEAVRNSESSRGAGKY